jgi:hypothetical protein
MRYPRVGVVIAIAFALLATGASSAWACLEPNAQGPGGIGSVQTAGPNDPVDFVIPTAEPGADIEVTVGGKTFRFESTSYGFQGTFPMPDIGEKPQTVYPDVVATHDEDGGQPTRSSLTVNYTGHPAAAPPGGQAPESSSPAPVAEQGANPEQVGDPAPSTPATGTETPATGPGGAGPTAGPGGGGPADGGSAQAESQSSTAADAISVNAALGASAAESAGALESVGATTSADAKALGDAEGAASGDASSATESTPATEATPATRIPIPAPAAREGGVAPMGAGLLVLAAMGGIALFLLRRRGSPPDGDGAIAPAPWIPPSVRREMSAREAMIEAELQEMISEERAKRVLSRREDLPEGELAHPLP